MAAYQYFYIEVYQYFYIKVWTRLIPLTQWIYRSALYPLTRIGSDRIGSDGRSVSRSVGWVSSFNKDRVKLLTLIIINCKLHIRHLFQRLSLVLVRGNTALLIMT